MLPKLITSALIALALPVFLSCEDDEGGAQYKDFGNQSPGPSGAAAEAQKRLAEEKAKKNDEKAGSGLELPQLSETTFIPGPKRRDPFLPFLDVFGKSDKQIQKVEEEVKLKEFDVAQLKLVGIVTNIGDPRAMVVTPDGTGFVIRRGDYIGRADFIKQGNQGEQIQVNWRVARIHGTGKEEERGVYLIRDDPTTSRGVDVTRFMALHPSE